MKLDRLVLVNWGQLRSDDYDMGGMTLLTGQTGSGKSTMLDGLQTVMTAAIQISQTPQRWVLTIPSSMPSYSRNGIATI